MLKKACLFNDSLLFAQKFTGTDEYGVLDEDAWNDICKEEMEAELGNTSDYRDSDNECEESDCDDSVSSDEELVSLDACKQLRPIIQKIWREMDIKEWEVKQFDHKKTKRAVNHEESFVNKDCRIELKHSDLTEQDETSEFTIKNTQFAPKTPMLPCNAVESSWAEAATFAKKQGSRLPFDTCANSELVSPLTEVAGTVKQSDIHAANTVGFEEKSVIITTTTMKTIFRAIGNRTHSERPVLPNTGDPMKRRQRANCIIHPPKRPRADDDVRNRDDRELKTPDEISQPLLHDVASSVSIPSDEETITSIKLPASGKDRLKIKLNRFVTGTSQGEQFTDKDTLYIDSANMYEEVILVKPSTTHDPAAPNTFNEFLKSKSMVTYGKMKWPANQTKQTPSGN